MRKVDFRKTLKQFYGPSAKEVVAADVPAMSFLMIDGEGDPGDSPEFTSAVEALYPLAYTLKFSVKKDSLAIDYRVMPLEGLWWADDMSDFVTGRRDRWKWTLMIMQPEFISDEMYSKAVEEVRRKKNPPALDCVRFESFEEGPVAQILHVGPFSAEGPTIEKVHRFIEDSGHRLAGRHHEIYLSDMRRTAPARLRTIIRQPYA